MHLIGTRVFAAVLALSVSTPGAAFANLPPHLCQITTPTTVVTTTAARASATSSPAVTSGTRRNNSNNNYINKLLVQTRTTAATMSSRGGGDSVLKSTATPTPSATASVSPPKRIRIQSLDGIRALLAIHIVCGHFLRYAQPSDVLLRFFAQINVTVGAFFALSGYVTAYTSTEVAQREASPKLTQVSASKWWLQKVMAFFPMHWLVLLLFSPMFIYSDTTYGGWGAATINGLLSATLTQSWAPDSHAEVWVRIIFLLPSGCVLLVLGTSTFAEFLLQTS
jgi:Acyltransferase family